MALVSRRLENSDQSGTTGADVKPITDSEVVVTQQDSSNPSFTQQGGFYGFLDQLGGIAAGAVGEAAQSYADQRVDEIAGNPTIDNSGDPFDQPGNERAESNQPFYEKYKKELLIGGAALVGAFALFKLVK